MQMRNLAQSIVSLSSILTLGACGTQELVDEASSEPVPEMGSTEQELVGNCYGPAPVGCSVLWFAYYFSPTLNYYGNNKFESACVMHDYCYHHGNMTYGKSRATCDNEFKAAMESACSGWSWLDIVTLGGSKADCYANAKLFYDVVSKHGGQYFKYAPDDGCCQYSGPPKTSICGCVPSCGAKQCGSNGCGGSCGTCSGDQKCSGGRCVPAPDVPCRPVKGTDCP